MASKSPQRRTRPKNRVLLAMTALLLLPQWATAQNFSERPYLLNGLTTTQPLEPVTQQALKSVVELKNTDGQLIAFGTIVSADGFVITKASELVNVSFLSIKLADERAYRAAVVGIDEENDLALLETEGRDLTPVQWADDSKFPDLGTMVLVPTRADGTMMGVISARSRTVIREHGLMGITKAGNPEDPNGAPVVGSVSPNSGAESAGIKVGDTITAIDGTEVTDWMSMREIIIRNPPGRIISVTLVRDGQILTVQVTLGRMNEMGEETRRNAILSGPTSRRQGGFTQILQHHIPIKPEHCGGPLLDLDGKAIGINIARVNRSESFALPAPLVKEAVAKLRQELDAAMKELASEETKPVSTE